METITFALLEPEVDDNVIQDASLEAVHAAFEVIEMLFEVEADVTEMFDDSRCFYRRTILRHRDGSAE